MAGTVTVACKLPTGLHLDLMADADAEGRRSAMPKARVTIKGCALPVGVVLPEDAPRVLGGYALTPEVDEDFWNAWLKQNADYGPVKQNLIFALPKLGSAEAKAREQSAVVSGLEPINPARPPVKGIAPADRVPA